MNLSKTLIILAILTLYILSLIGMSYALVIKSVSTEPAEIAPGETSIIKIGLENDGENSIIDASVVLDLKDAPFAPYGSSSEESIDEIEEDEDETASFRVIALNDAKAGIYKIPMIITYTENDKTKTKNSLISIAVNSKPVLRIDVEDGLLLKGNKNKLPVRITNKGLSDVKFLEIRILDLGYTNVLSQKSVYVGDVDSDDYDSAEFEIFFDKDISDKILLPVEVTYRDVTNKEFSETFNIPVNIYTKEKAIGLGLMQQSYTWYYIGGVVVLVVLFFVYRSWKRKRRLRKANEDKEF